MPFQKDRYPPDWKTISLRIRERENWRCKWCGVPNGETGARDCNGEWHEELAIHHMNSGVGESLFPDGFPKMTKIVLTVAHLGTPHADGTPGDKHDKMDCRDNNLAALCQRCHLRYDMDEHVANAKRTRQRKKREAIAATGQAVLFE